MRARETIARACTQTPDECYHGSASFGLTSGQFHCLVKMWERELPHADAIISALTAAGYRILSPDEVQAVERLCNRAEKWERNSDSARVSVRLGDLRALKGSAP